MIDFLWHLLLGIGIGAYFFNSNVRSGVNDIIKRIAVGLYTALNEHYNGKQRKAPSARHATNTPKQESVGYRTSGTVKSLVSASTENTEREQLQSVKGLYPCTCGGILEPVNGWPNYYACAKCHTLKEVSKTKI